MRTRYFFLVGLSCILLSLFINQCSAGCRQAPDIRILIGSPIRQKPTILKEFLFSLERLSEGSNISLDNRHIIYDYCFIDDNTDEASRELLQQFNQKKARNCFLYTASIDESNVPYMCNETTHYWSDEGIWKVATFKNALIYKAQQDNYDYLFLIDSDIVLNPRTVTQLMNAQKDIISEIFWTRWAPDQQELPQVWLSDVYNLTQDFIKQLQTPGIYEVGGLGACTLISKKALDAGVSFNKIKNITFWGEDRHFCVRAVALGLSLFVDTHLPAYHIYRESALVDLPAYKEKNGLTVPTVSEVQKKHTITLAMCVKNEADRYLRNVLQDAKTYIDAAVIIDDGSTDDTVAICKEVLQGIPVHIIHNEESRFGNEITLREQQWIETLKTNPDWILVLDADEIFEETFKYKVRDLIAQDAVDVWCFRLYDFWNDHQYRDDALWSSHNTYRPFLVRYKNDFNYEWKRQAHHCGRLPKNVMDLPCGMSNLRLKHYGWSSHQDRVEKYHRYLLYDPKGEFGSMVQYESILDQAPHLVDWQE